MTTAPFAVDSALLREEGGLFIAFVFTPHMLFCHNDDSSGFTVAQCLSSHDTQN